MYTTRKALDQALTEARRYAGPNVMAVCAHCYGSLFPYGHWVLRDGIYFCNAECAGGTYRPGV